MRTCHHLLLASVACVLSGCQSSDKSSARSSDDGRPPVGSTPHPVANLAPQTSVTKADRPNGESTKTANPCEAWTVVPERPAEASLEVFCQRFGPCPATIAEAGEKEPFGSPPLVSATRRGIWLSYGTVNGMEYAFDRQGKLVGASVWRESPFGDCGDRVSRYRGGHISDVGDDETLERCGFVPGRDLLSQSACGCERPKDRPTRIGLDSGPRLQLSLDCLYEFGLVGDFCQRKLTAARRQPDSEQTDMGGGCVRVSARSFDADCLYDGQGELREMRIGKRFVSPKFGTYCRKLDR